MDKGRKSNRKSDSCDPKSNRGGSRLGSGRPAETGISVPWRQIRADAEAGAPLSEIVQAYELDESRLRSAGLWERLEAAVHKGNAEGRRQLFNAIKKRGRDSSQVLALAARNLLGWDKSTDLAEEPPDLESARARLRDTFTRLAKARSAIEGREVTPEMLLHREAFVTEGKGARS